MSFLGPWKPTAVLRVGQMHFVKKPTTLSPNQKAGVRRRLREEDCLIQTLVESNVPCEGLEDALKLKSESEMTPREKYFVFDSHNPKTHMKPITWVPHYTKTPHPRGFPVGYKAPNEVREASKQRQ